MAAAYITVADVDAAITAAVRADLLSDDDDGGAGAGTFATDLYEKASELVKAAAANAGYSLSTTTTSQQVKLATLGQFLNLLYNRKQQELPPAFYEAYNMLERIRTGDLELTDYTASTSTGVGGAKFSETNSSISGARYNIFSRTKLSGY